MSRLSDLISAGIDERRDTSGRCDHDEVVAAIFPDIDDDDRDALAKDALLRRVKAGATSGLAEIGERSASKQLELPFRLERAYTLDLGGRYSKATRELTRIELARLIEIRERGIAADQSSLDDLKLADAATRAIWNAHPDWSFGQCLDEAMRLARAA